MIVQFRTETSIPLEAFSLLGVNVKTSSAAIGRFGTGLKYAVAVILRHGGSIKLFVEGVEYEFYLSDKKFRDKTFQQVRMRKKHGTLNKWLSSKALPFTTEFGKDWGLWQAYRELESNTRDEGGVTWKLGDETPHGMSALNDPDTYVKGTVIEVECPNFVSQIDEADVFLPQPDDRGDLVYSDSMVDIYDRPSKHLYYQGIRVYALRYPARMTYDFKAPHVTLTEDRTAANSWHLMYYLAAILQTKVNRRDVLYKVLSKSRDENRYAPTFETMELNFDHTEEGSDDFKVVASSLADRGIGGKSVSGYYGSFTAYRSRSDEVSVSMPRALWDQVKDALKKNPDAAYYEGVIKLFDKLDGVQF